MQTLFKKVYSDHVKALVNNLYLGHTSLESNRTVVILRKGTCKL